MLLYLNTLNIGWAKSINEKLQKYNIEKSWNKIEKKTKLQWKEKVKTAILKKNKEKILEQCVNISNGERKTKAKSKHIYDKLSNENFYGEPQKELVDLSKQRLKTILLARYGMLECGIIA